MSGDTLPLVDVPDWIDHLLVDVAVAVATGAFLSYLVLVFPDPESLFALPTVLTLDPVVWVWVSLSVLCFPFLRWSRAGERAVVWWDEHVE